MKQRGRGADSPNIVRGGGGFGSYAMYSPDIDYTSIGQKLRAERERIGQTQEQVAEVLGITPAFVGHIERSERSMSLNTLIKFCNHYHVTIDYLLSDILPPEDDNALSQIADILKDKSSDQQAAILDILRSVIRHV
jgi:transcriptional regulator with XRE-family HTH domain